MLSTKTVAAHVVVVVLAVLQCALAAVLAYRLYLLSRTYKGADSRRRGTGATFLKVQRGCIFFMTILQCVRALDPFAALGIISYGGGRVIQLAVTITIYFEYSATSYVVMDTLYACALKRTPSWLAVVVTILPVTEAMVGFSMLICTFTIGQNWANAVINFYVVFMFAVNLVTYNTSGLLLIRILVNHNNGATGTTSDDISGSKSASPFGVVIKKTIKSMILLDSPSLAALILFLQAGIGNCNTRPIPAFDPTDLSFGVIATVYLQLILGLIFTRMSWINKTALDAEIMNRTASPPSSHGTPSGERTTRTMSRADTKDRAVRMSQSPKPRQSESPVHLPVEMQETTPPPSVAVTVDVAVTVEAVEGDSTPPTVDNSVLVYNEADIV